MILKSNSKNILYCPHLNINAREQMQQKRIRISFKKKIIRLRILIKLCNQNETRHRINKRTLKESPSKKANLLIKQSRN